MTEVTALLLGENALDLFQMVTIMTGDVAYQTFYRDPASLRMHPAALPFLGRQA